MTIEKCRSCKHAFTTSKDRLYCKKALADKDDCEEYEVTDIEILESEIELVIKISEVQKKMVDAIMELPEQVENDLISAIRHGTLLPKGHGRLIDVNSIYQIVRPIEPSDAEWGMTAETAKQIIHDVFDSAPTIIEANGGDVE